MFVKQKTKIREVRVEVNSSLVKYMIYRPDSYTLKVKYKRGKKRWKLQSYPEVGRMAFSEIIHSESVGKALIGFLRERG